MNNYINRHPKDQEKNTVLVKKPGKTVILQRKFKLSNITNVPKFEENYKLSPDFLHNPNKYLNKYRGRGKDVFKALFAFKCLPVIYKSNTSIARFIKEKTGKSVTERTIRAWTSRFQKEGILQKVQVNNRYDLNCINFNPKIITGKLSFNLWITTLTSKQLNAYISVGKIGLQKKIKLSDEQTFLQNRINITENNIYINNLNPTLKKGKERLPVNLWWRKKITSMLSREKKALLISGSKKGNIRNVIEDPKVKPLIFTPLMGEICSILKLNFNQKLKLTAFTEHALKFVKETLLKKQGKQATSIGNNMGWVVHLATYYSNRNNLSIDWKWYHTLREAYQVEIDPPINKKAPRGQSPNLNREVQPEIFSKPVASDNVYYGPLVFKMVNENCPKLSKNTRGISNCIVEKDQIVNKESCEDALKRLNKEILDWQNTLQKTHPMFISSTRVLVDKEIARLNLEISELLTIKDHKLRGVHENAEILH